jgi:hypothetical protein
VFSRFRDWGAHPAIVELELPADAPVFAVSDVHGGYERLAALLARHAVIAPDPASLAAARWTGAAAVLVVVGDTIDKGPRRWRSSTCCARSNPAPARRAEP